jgi:hypothetical protein
LPLGKPARVAVVPQFAVILRQASFFVPVEYHKSTLSSQKTRLPRLTANLDTILRYQITLLKIASFNTHNNTQKLVGLKNIFLAYFGP